MELSGSKDNKIAEIEMISMLSTNDVVAKISNSVRFMVGFGIASSTVRWSSSDMDLF